MSAKDQDPFTPLNEEGSPSEMEMMREQLRMLTQLILSPSSSAATTADPKEVAALKAELLRYKQASRSSEALEVGRAREALLKEASGRSSKTIAVGGGASAAAGGASVDASSTSRLGALKKSVGASLSTVADALAAEGEDVADLKETALSMPATIETRIRTFTGLEKDWKRFKLGAMACFHRAIFVNL